VNDMVCKVCGLRIEKTFKGNWRHWASGTTAPSCGKVPIPMSREAYDAEITAIHAAVKHHLIKE